MMQTISSKKHFQRRQTNGLRLVLGLLAALLFAVTNGWAAGGDLLWQLGDSRTGKQESLAAAQDSAGNVILAGYSTEASEDIYTVKLAADGSGVLWSALFDRAGGIDRATAVAVDHNDDVIVAGFVDNGVSIDFQVIKYCGVTRSGVCTAGQVLWQHTWDSPNHGDDFATAVGVDALGDIYVGGYTQGTGGSDDFLLIKYKENGPAPDGSPLWQQTYNGPAGGEDRIMALAVNDTGVVVTGHSQNATPDFDVLTIKYGQDGTKLWESRFDGGHGDDRGMAVAMDTDGNVAVAGVSYDGSHKTMVTQRLAAADGAVLWSQSYGAGNLNEPRAVAVDLAGDVYLTGVTFTATGKNDFYTARYRATDGTLVWEQIANSGGDNADTPSDIAVDEAGDVYVTGYAHKATSGDDDFFTLKYKRDTGTMLWSHLFNGPASGNDQAVAVAVGLTPAGNLLVAGWADQTTDGLDNPDFYAIAYDAGLLNPPTDLQATTVSETGIDLAWTNNATNADGFILERCLGLGCEADPANFTVVDAAIPPTQTLYHDTGLTPHRWYVYRIKATSSQYGDSHYSNTAQALTTVFTPSPPTWIFQHDGPEQADDRADDIAVGPDGDPVATGSQLSPNLGSGGFDYYTVKLKADDGSEQWHVLYNDPDDELDVATCVGVDTNNDVVVSGYASLYNAGSGNSNDIYTLKYPAAGPPEFGPPELWAVQYDGPAGGDDRSVAIDLEAGPNNTVVVTGYGKNAAFNDDIYVIKYAADGSQLWAAIPYDGPGNGNDYPSRVRIAPNGDVVICGTVAGTVDDDFFVQKLSGSDGSVLWTVLHDSGNGPDGCNDLAIGADGSIYAVGLVTGANGDEDWYVERYGADGTPVWGGITVDGDGHGYDEAVAVRVDTLRNEIVIAGNTTSTTGSIDFHLRRLAADGSLVWSQTLDRDVTDDFVAGMAMDAAGDVYLAGDAADTANVSDILAVAYDPEGNLTGSLLYDGVAGRDDTARAITVNATGAAFIAGATTTAGDDTDYLVLRFDADMLVAPSPFTATPYYTSVDLAWTDRSENEDGFELRRAPGSCAAATDADFTVVTTLAAGTTTYTDSGLVEGDTYCYRIQAFTNAGLRSLPLETEAATIVPPPPAAITATVVDANTVTISWTDATDGEDVYGVARCEGSGCTDFTEIATVPAGETSFTDSSLCAGTTYRYTVRALRTGDWSSAYGTPAEATPPAAQAPINFTATRISEGNILLDWTDPNLETDTQALVIERCQGTGCTDFAPLATMTDLIGRPEGALVAFAMDEAAWNGTAGEVLDDSGNDNHGTAVGGVTTIDAGHTGRAGSFDGVDDEVTFSYQGGTPTNNFTLAAWVQTSATHQIDTESTSGTGGTGGQHYLFGADHHGSDAGAGVSVGTNGISVYEHGAGYMPALAVYSGDLGTGWNHVVITYVNKQPYIYLNGVKVRTGRTSFRQTVFAPTRIGGGPYGHFAGRIDEVVVYDRALSDTEVNQLYTLSYRKHRYHDTAVVPDTTYRYQIAADKPGACGWPSPYAGPVEATATMLDPSPLTATVTSTTSVDLAWADNFGTESQFTVERCDSGACDTAWTTSTSFTVAADTSSFTDTGLCNGQTVSYRVAADHPGSPGWPSPYSNIVTVTTPSVAPPADFTATRISEEEIQLTWSPSTTDEEYLTLERCSGATCDFSSATSITLAAGTSSYRDTNLTPDTVYRYRLRAEKPSSACGWTTAWSAIGEAATTLTPPALLSGAAADTTSVDLGWQDTTGNETDFLLERCTGSGCTDFQPVAAAPHNATGGTDTSACYGTTYTYRITAVSQGLTNGGLGCWSQRLPLTITNLVPESPVRIQVDYRAGMRADFADIRFYDETADRELPYTITSKTDGVRATVWFRPGSNATVWLYYGNPQATDASDPEAVFLLADTFPGTTIDTSRWTEIDPDGAIGQNDGLELHYVSSSWTRALISEATFDRAAGLTLYAEILPQDGPANDYFMLGWEQDQTSNPSYNQLVHALYWSDYYISVYELGSYKGYKTYFSYMKTGQAYEIKMVLKASGARYYVRKKGAASWVLVNESDNLTTSPLRVAVTLGSHEARISMLAVLPADTIDTTVTFGTEEQSDSCYTFPNTWSSVSTSTVEVTTGTPTAPYNLAATALSESEIRLDWQDDNGDEDGFAIDRCQGSGCTTFTEIATVGPDTLTYTDTGLAMTTTYTYRVRAVKYSTCTWPELTTSTAEATTPAPPAPSGITATAVDGGHVRLDWTDTTSSNTGFVIERCAGLGCTNFTEIGIIGDVQTFLDDTVCPEIPYSYRVTAVNEDVGVSLANSGGNTWSRQAPVTISDFTPDAPVRLTVPWTPSMQPDFDDLRFYDSTAGVELPYFIVTKTDGVSADLWFKPGANDTVILYYGNPNAGPVADETAVFEFYDDFRGTNIDTGKWVVIDAYGKFSQNDGLGLVYKNSGWNTALISKTTIDRVEGKALYITFRPQDGPGGDYVMMGWEQDQTTDANYNQLVHGLYWPNFSALRPYEKGSVYGSYQVISYQAGNRYEMKIVLTASGARYLVSGDGLNGWREISNSSLHNDTPLRIAITQNSHVGIIDEVRVMADVAVVPTATLGPATSGSRIWTGDPGTAAPTDLVPPPPTPPTGLTATLVSETEVDLSWTDTAPTDHRVERCADASCTDFTTIATVADPGGGTSSYSDIGLIGATDYTYRVAPVVGNGTCAWENYGATVAITTTPACPASLQVTGNGTTTVDLSWTDTTASETGFVIDRCAGSGCTNFVQVATVGPDTTIYTDTTALPNTTYTYQVRAVNDSAGWDSGACGPVTVTTATPAPPQNLTAAWGSESRIELSWDATGGDEDGFIVERGDAGCANFVVVDNTVPAGATSYTDTGLDRNTTYCYRVTAFKNQGQANEWQAGPSNTATAITSLLPPTNLAATATDTTTVALAWLNRTDTEEAVVVERCEGAGCDFSTVTTFTLPAGTNTYTDETACGATTYQYRVRTTNTTAGWDSGPSTAVAVTTPSPTAPQLTVTEVYQDTDTVAMTLAWQDTNLDEDGFAIERCQGAACTDFTTIATAPAAVNLDDFTNGIDPNRWVQEGQLNTVTTTTPPTDITDDSGTVTIDDSNGAVVFTVSSTGTTSGWNIGRIDLLDPTSFGVGDFDLRLTLHLPDGTPAPTAGVKHRPLRVRISFPDPDDYGPLTHDYFYLDRYVDANGNGYEAVFRVNGVQSTASLPAASDTVTIRMSRTAGVLAVAVDEGGGFVEVGHAGPVTTGGAPTLVRIQTMADRSEAVSLQATVDDILLVTAEASYTDTGGLGPETTYCYRVVATKASSCAWDPTVLPVVSPVVCDTSRPPAPQGLAATALDSRTIQLDWTSSATTAQGFLIDKLAPNGRWVTVDRVASGSPSYIVRFGIDPEKTYNFRVRSYRDEDFSGFSNEASVTTPAWQEGDGTCIQ